MTYAARARSPVEDPGSRHKANAFRDNEHAVEIFAVLIILKTYVPGPCCLGQLPAHQPSSVLHVEIFAHFLQEPFDWSKILTQGVSNKLGVASSKVEGSPGRGKKHSFTVTLPQRRELPLDFVRH